MAYSTYEEVYEIIKQCGPINFREICDKVKKIHGYNFEPRLYLDSEISGYLSGLSQNGHIKALPHQKISNLRKTDLQINEWIITKP